MDIYGQIKEIQHQAFLTPNLKEFSFQSGTDFNSFPAVFVLKNKHNRYAVSKWGSPKRTRSYPFARVYDTLNYAKKITIIPLIKDEGSDGDRDFLQWDTVALMSLLDVYVIICYYDLAQKVGLKNKITNQQFNNQYICNKIVELESYQSSALHWNLRQLDTVNLSYLCKKVQESYNKISEQTYVKLHNPTGILKFQQKIEQDLNFFKEFSRTKSTEAQNREFKTTQPKEHLNSLTKAKITLSNYLGGLYFLTVDEVLFKNNYIYLIESKHSKNDILPKLLDIKDGLLKLILYANLKKVQIKDETFLTKSVLQLTSTQIVGKISSDDDEIKKEMFLHANKFNFKVIQLIQQLFFGAQNNNFLIQIEQV